MRGRSHAPGTSLAASWGGAHRWPGGRARHKRACGQRPSLPADRQRAQTRVSSFGLLCIYDGAHGGETPQHWTHWGRHYEECERDLSKTERPPYVTNLKGASVRVT